MSTATRSSRLRLIGAVAFIGIILLGFLAWWFLFRDDAPAAVDSDEAAEARQEAIDAATEATDEPASPQTVDADDPAQADAPASDQGQPDAAASVGSATDGVWTIDNSIGTFGPECLEVACSSTFIGFRINEELAGIGAKTVVGRTPGVSGSIEVSGTQIVSAEIVADMTQLLTDNPARTDALRFRDGGLETNAFPEARFVLTQPIELGEIPVEGVAITADATGDLTVHGVTRQETITLTAELQAGLVVIFGNLEGMLLADYEIPTPSAVVVLSVEDNATMELQLFLSQ